jgi:hypothetical protein
MKVSEDLDVPVSLCIKCHNRLTATANLTHKRKPKQGDLSLCVFCYSWLVFDETLHQRNLTDEEIRRIEADEPLLWMEMTRIGDFVKNLKEKAKNDLRQNKEGEL